MRKREIVAGDQLTEKLGLIVDLLLDWQQATLALHSSFFLNGALVYPRKSLGVSLSIYM